MTSHSIIKAFNIFKNSLHKWNYNNSGYLTHRIRYPRPWSIPPQVTKNLYSPQFELFSLIFIWGWISLSNGFDRKTQELGSTAKARCIDALVCYQEPQYSMGTQSHLYFYRCVCLESNWSDSWLYSHIGLCWRPTFVANFDLAGCQTNTKLYPTRV